jgi:Concanavalin A-like lectin/glucanases superfamily
MRRSWITRLPVAIAAAAAVTLLLAGPANAAAPIHWGMNEPPGTGTMSDDNGGHVGTWQDIVADGSGYNFNGTSSRVVVPDAADGSLDPGTANFSYSVRFRTTVIPDDVVGDFDLLRKGLSGTNGGYYKVELYPNRSNTKARALCQAKGNSGGAKLVGNTNLADGNPHTITCEKTASAFNMYVDGVLKASKAGALGAIANKVALTVGAKHIGGDWYEGFMDEATLAIG